MFIMLTDPDAETNSRSLDMIKHEHEYRNWVLCNNSFIHMKLLLDKL